MQKNKLDKGFLGNPNIKPFGANIDWTQEMVEEWEKCYRDPIYFTEKYVKIINLNKGLVNFVPYDYQREIIQTIHDERFTILACCRQSGKCLTGDNKLNIRNKNTGEVISVTFDEFNYMMSNKDNANLSTS